MNENLGLLGKLELEFDFDIVDDFMTHFNIFCDALEPVIISLSNKEKYSDKINELFRMFHNMKSASGFLKINQFVNICKIVEDVLDEARTLSGPASDELIDWLLLVTDQFIIYKHDFNDDKAFLSALNPAIISLPTRLN